VERNKILYENIFVPAEKDIGDYVVHQLQKRTPLSVTGTLAVVVLLCVLWARLSSTGIINNSFLHLFFAVILMVSIMAADTILKHSEFRRLVKKFTRQNKDDLSEIRTLFYEDRVDANGKIYGYPEFSRVLYGDSCMFLMTAKAKVVMIKDDPAAFGLGDTAEFWDFLNGKCTLKAPEKQSDSPLSFRKSL
jgi:hypothetical protein